MERLGNAGLDRLRKGVNSRFFFFFSVGCVLIKRSNLEARRFYAHTRVQRSVIMHPRWSVSAAAMCQLEIDVTNVFTVAACPPSPEIAQVRVHVR